MQKVWKQTNMYINQCTINKYFFHTNMDVNPCKLRRTPWHVTRYAGHGPDPTVCCFAAGMLHAMPVMGQIQPSAALLDRSLACETD